MARLHLGAIGALVVAASIGAPGTASAAMVYFDCITNNSAANCQTGAAQLSVEVESAGVETVRFVFRNTGPGASSITDVYFDDGTLLALASVTNGPGVDFAQYASPGNLPGANNADPDFQTTAGFLADSNPPTQQNGVNPGEVLTIFFTLQASQNVADVLADLADGGLRIGLHVQGFTSGDGESFVNRPLLTPVPLPAAAWLLMSGLGALGVFSRRRD